jgi:VanZ family protein
VSVRRWLPGLGWATLIVVGTSIPAADVPPSPDGTDKVVHLLVYAVLGLLLTRAAVHEWPRKRPAVLAAALIAATASFGALDELHQRFIPGRFADVADWLADATGATLAIVLTIAARARREPST